jgi:hypothetical protein
MWKNYINISEESCSHVQVCSSSVYNTEFFWVQAPPASVIKLGKSDTPLLPTEYKYLSGTNFEKWQY